jgi:penicillin-binding protein 1B
MRDNRYIDGAQYEQAVQAPLGLNPGINDMSETQYFVDMASDRLGRQLGETRNGSAYAYTTIDLRLQRAAEQAVQDGMALVDKQLSRGTRAQADAPKPQVALIAIDPHTGDVKALIGGRDYTTSQLDRVMSKRPPGSVFKPFVYTAAINSAVEGGDRVFTPASTILDAATTIQYGDETYSPNNFGGVFMGQVTLRQALAHSLNNATVKLAEQVGFDKVAALAHRAGLNGDIRATPSVALGAYDVTPLEIASAYTIFANGGVRVAPNFIAAVHNQRGDALYVNARQTHRVLDPRVAFILTDMLQEVLRSGTGAGVRSRGFRLDAAGKTGTSHDGWFAGYTSQILCVVWVGFDDYRELKLEGAKSALPIWTQFMMTATRYKEYRNAKPFSPPAGVVRFAVDPTTGRLAGPNCEGVEADYFVEGTQPAATCPEPETPKVTLPAPATIVPTADRRQ